MGLKLHLNGEESVPSKNLKHLPPINLCSRTGTVQKKLIEDLHSGEANNLQANKKLLLTQFILKHGYLEVKAGIKTNKPNILILKL